MNQYVKTNSLYKFYLRVITSIAFVPTLIAVLLFLLSLFTLYLDQGSPDRLVGYKIGIESLINPDSARSLLSAIAGGMISLMVFSFTMVMVVLNQTSSNYSPRVLPSLIGQRSHQVIMGFYLGTIAFTFVVLTSIQSKIYAFEIPSLSIIINTLLSLISLALFVSFIQSISEDIQIGNIINNIYAKTLKSLEREIQKKTYVSEDTLPDTAHWHVIKSPVSGYYNNVDERTFLKTTQKLGVAVKILIPAGKYISRGEPFFAISSTLEEERQHSIFETFVFHHQEVLAQNYVFGFKQLTEIAVKALSPGINDPGTAIQAIDRLTDLFIHRLDLPDCCVLKDDQHELRMIATVVPIEDLFYFSFSAIRNYAGQDIPVLHKLLLLVGALLENNKNQQVTGMLLTAVYDLIEQFSPEIRSHSDKLRLTQLIEQLLARRSHQPEEEKIRKKLAEFLHA